jgi:hypothetical protein
VANVLLCWFPNSSLPNALWPRGLLWPTARHRRLLLFPAPPPVLLPEFRLTALLSLCCLALLFCRCPTNCLPAVIQLMDDLLDLLFVPSRLRHNTQKTHRCRPPPPPPPPAPPILLLHRREHQQHFGPQAEPAAAASSFCWSSAGSSLLRGVTLSPSPPSHHSSVFGPPVGFYICGNCEPGNLGREKTSRKIP